MTALRTLLAAGGAATVLLAIALSADAQVMVNRGINPWTGHAYRNVAIRNPWTGRVATSTTVVDPWTGATVRSTHRYNPWTGRSAVTWGGMYNPWTNQVLWDVPRRRRW